MSEKIEKLTPRDRRIVKHVRTIAEAGQDIERFAAAIRDVRDDAKLTSAKREAIWKTLAQEAAQAYYVFATGEPIDFEKLLAEMPEPGG